MSLFLPSMFCLCLCDGTCMFIRFLKPITQNHINCSSLSQLVIQSSHSVHFYFHFGFWPCHACRLVLQPGLKSISLQWKHGVNHSTTTRKSCSFLFLKHFFKLPIFICDHPVKTTTILLSIIDSPTYSKSFLNIASKS